MATKKTAQDTWNQTTEAAKQNLHAFGLKGVEVTEKALDESAAVQDKVRGQAFEMMAKQVEMQASFLGFLAENQRAMFEMMKAQSDSAHQLAFQGMRDATAQARQALEQN